ncbi:(2Fe-2S) ferredoxin [Paenibacillus shirakamiensis]|uniref:(2Fe-2S) ferredoxin n=2 Tax=Paenibacillus shirakamiensis TaxID=1265935 RepID=A0ABS4JHN3_9BACL|nr:(2Fe-2S) ferredoxin [Paenibacillus shirakamiensis]
MKNGAGSVAEGMRREISSQQAKSNIQLSKTSCMGRCSDACTLAVYPQGDWFKEMNEKLGKKLIRRLSTGQAIGKRLTKHRSYSMHGPNAQTDR